MNNKKLDKKLAIEIKRQISKLDDYFTSKDELIESINFILDKEYGDSEGVMNRCYLLEIQQVVNDIVG